jgi:hypothetical protein
MHRVPAASVRPPATTRPSLSACRRVIPACIGRGEPKAFTPTRWPA